MLDITKLLSNEKITINLGYVDLGRIDLLVQEGFYSNRTDLIRTAVRDQLAAHSDAVKQSQELRRPVRCSCKNRGFAQNAGLEFIPGNGGGAGVRLAKGGKRAK